MLSINEVLRKLRYDRTVNESNIIERIKKEFESKEGYIECKEEYESWEKSKFSIEHLFKIHSYKISLFSISVLYSYFNIAKHLKGAGADINSRDKEEGLTPLHMASITSNVGAVRLLLKEGAKTTEVDKSGRIALYYAKDKSIEKYLISELLKSKFVDFVDGCGETPLHYLRRESVVKLLIDNGANVNALDKSENTPLHLASMTGDVGMVKLLIEARAKINTKNKQGYTALQIMVMHSKYDENIFLTMLEHGADPWSRPGLIGFIRLLKEVKGFKDDKLFAGNSIKLLRLFCMSPVDKCCFVFKKIREYDKRCTKLLFWIAEEVLDKYRSLPDDHPKYFLKLSEANNRAQRFVCAPTLFLLSIEAAILFKTNTITVNALSITAAVSVVMSLAIAANYAAYEVFKPSLKLAIKDSKEFTAKQSQQSPLICV